MRPQLTLRYITKILQHVDGAGLCCRRSCRYILGAARSSVLGNALEVQSKPTNQLTKQKMALHLVDEVDVEYGEALVLELVPVALHASTVQLALRRRFASTTRRRRSRYANF